MLELLPKLQKGIAGELALGALELFINPSTMKGGKYDLKRRRKMKNYVNRNCADAHELKGKENSEVVEEYLTLRELSKRIKYKEQTLYNYIHEGKFIFGTHYLKPSPKKIIFKWSEILAWITDKTKLKAINKCKASPIKKNKKDDFENCLIKI